MSDVKWSFEDELFLHGSNNTQVATPENIDTLAVKGAKVSRKVQFSSYGRFLWLRSNVQKTTLSVQRFQSPRVKHGRPILLLQHASQPPLLVLMTVQHGAIRDSFRGQMLSGLQDHQIAL